MRWWWESNHENGTGWGGFFFLLSLWFCLFFFVAGHGQVVHETPQSSAQHATTRSALVRLFLVQVIASIDSRPPSRPPSRTLHPISTQTQPESSVWFWLIWLATGLLCRFRGFDPVVTGFFFIFCYFVAYVRRLPSPSIRPAPRRSHVTNWRWKSIVSSRFSSFWGAILLDVPRSFWVFLCEYVLCGEERNFPNNPVGFQVAWSIPFQSEMERLIQCQEGRETATPKKKGKKKKDKRENLRSRSPLWSPWSPSTESSLKPKKKRKKKNLFGYCVLLRLGRRGWADFFLFFLFCYIFLCSAWAMAGVSSFGSGRLRIDGRRRLCPAANQEMKDTPAFTVDIAPAGDQWGSLRFIGRFGRPRVEEEEEGEVIEEVEKWKDISPSPNSPSLNSFSFPFQMKIPFPFSFQSLADPSHLVFHVDRIVLGFSFTAVYFRFDAIFQECHWLLWMNMGFTGFYLVFVECFHILLVASRFYWIWQGFTGFYYFLLVFSWIFTYLISKYLVLLGFTGFYYIFLFFLEFFFYFWLIFLIITSYYRV